MRSRAFGPLGQRLFVAFMAVAMSSVAVLTTAALIGTSRGLGSAEAERRLAAAEQLAAAISDVLTVDGGVVTVTGDAARPITTADTLGVAFIARTTDGGALLAHGVGMGAGNGMMGAADTAGGRWLTADLTVDGTRIGAVAVRYPTPLESTAQTIAWSWIMVAALVSLLVAFALAILVSRRIARPLLRVSSAAQRFAGGDRSARTDPQDSGARWELGDLARAFDATADDVVRSEEARRRISADVAHELRTPLAALQAGLEELRDGLVAADPERLSALHAQSVRLGRVVGDLAALSAAETAALSLRHAPVELRALAEEALFVARPALEAAGLSTYVEPGQPIMIEGDADRLHQAVGNLLANAARYCRSGDTVSLRVTAEPTTAVLTVEDTGPGISSDELPHVFDRLWRGSAASDVAGSGIGLAVVRELVAAHGGSVDVTSDGVHGTTFTLRLPLAGT